MGWMVNLSEGQLPTGGESLPPSTADPDRIGSNAGLTPDLPRMSPDGPQRTSDVATRKILDETILVPIRGMVAQRMEIFSLNEVAAFVWKRLDGITTVGQLVEAVTAEFEVEPEQARADIGDLIGQLRELGLLADTGS